MPIADNNPERRNLMVTSLAFIIYFLGDGHFENGNVKIQAINITFDNLYVLTISSWVLLLWFYWRYSQKHKHVFLGQIQTEVKAEKSNPILIAYLKKKTKKPYLDEKGFLVSKITPSKGKWSAQIAMVDGGKRGENKQWIEYRAIDSSTFNINWAWLGIVKLSILIATFYKQPAFGSYFIPPVLFYIACILGLVELIKC